MVVRKSQQGGYVAFIAVMIVGAAAIAIAMALLLTGTDSQRSALIEQRSKQSRALAMACGQEALQQIHDNIAFSGTNNLSLGQGTCTYTVTVTSPTVRTVVVSGTVGTTVKKIQVSVTIGTAAITVSSWQEIG